MRRAYAANPDKFREKQLINKFGIDFVEYATLLADQTGRCKICLADVPGGIGDRFHVDHDHVSGRIRGLLCHHCDVGLGFFRDDPALLKQAIIYLETDNG